MWRQFAHAFLIGTALMASAHADTAPTSGPYIRFWRGWKLPALSYTDFAATIGNVFVPATVKFGVGQGMVAYLPVLPAETKPSILPDEVALVAYSDEPTYRALMQTPQGRQYGDLHWTYFDRSVSKSLVPVIYAGSVEGETAYSIFNTSVDWQQDGVPSFSIFLKGKSASAPDYLKDVKTLADAINIQIMAMNSVKGALVMVAADYVLIYENGKSLIPFLKLSTPSLVSFASYQLKTGALGEVQITPGSGLDVLFSKK